MTANIGISETIHNEPPDPGLDGPERSNIEIYLRVRPVAERSDGINIEQEEGSILFKIPHNIKKGLINNQREVYQFKFNGLFPASSTQEEVFHGVARSLVLQSLDGVNGTIFAYGQTGSGKTFTITGGPERYADRGIIPRAISLIFSTIAQRSDTIHVVHISYLEILNEAGYDLLDPDREVRLLEDLPRVHVLEDEEANIHMRNLSMHTVHTEEEALNLLFLGDTNRTISETPMNMASSRSHCIFTLRLEARKAGEDVVRKSKLNLVDLAGSERVSKTQINGSILREAKFINLSLHYLEQVIIALQERSMGQARPHVPYRNSMMTTVLRDSLGGNCRTVMIANVNGAQAQMDESISTCRFAERVAKISNIVTVNEEVEPEVVIRRLKHEIQSLKDEIRLLKGEQGPETAELTEEQCHALSAEVDAYVADASLDACLNLGADMRKIRYAVARLKTMVQCAGHTSTSGQDQLDPNQATGISGQQLRGLQLQVQQRDKEIATLIQLLRKAEETRATEEGHRESHSHQHRRNTWVQPTKNSTAMEGAQCTSGANHPRTVPSRAVLVDRDNAFQLFRESYSGNASALENKELLRKLLLEAKALGEEVSRGKGAVIQHSKALERHRLQRELQGITMGSWSEDNESDHQRENQIKDLMKQEKAKCRAAFGRLRQLKPEIQHLQLLIEKGRKEMQQGFEVWHNMMMATHHAPQNEPLERVCSEAQRQLPSSQDAVVPVHVFTDTPASAHQEQVQQNSAASEEDNIGRLCTLTGNAEADANIQRFYAARASLLRSQIFARPLASSYIFDF